MRTKIFTYKGFVGIQSSYNAEGLVNGGAGNGQVGFLVKAKSIDFTKEALEEIRKVKRGHDDLGEIDIVGSKDDPIFGWLGPQLRVLEVDKIEAARDTDYSMLDGIIPVEMDIPQDFIAFIDALEKEPT